MEILFGILGTLLNNNFQIYNLGTFQEKIFKYGGSKEDFIPYFYITESIEFLGDGFIVLEIYNSSDKMQNSDTIIIRTVNNFIGLHSKFLSHNNKTNPIELFFVSDDPNKKNYFPGKLAIKGNTAFYEYFIVRSSYYQNKIKLLDNYELLKELPSHAVKL